MLTEVEGLPVPVLPIATVHPLDHLLGSQVQILSSRVASNDSASEL